MALPHISKVPIMMETKFLATEMVQGLVQQQGRRLTHSLLRQRTQDQHRRVFEGPNEVMKP